jgi:23S rRNA (cytosine1962-C5)-methyltransferase
MSSDQPISLPPCVLHEDEHLLVVNKPAGWNTHAPSPHAGEGIYDWLKHREPRWASLAIIHRLDKDTSGVMVFGKTPLANRSLTDQFAARAVGKKYHLLTDRPVPHGERIVTSGLVRSGDRYVSGPHGEPAETVFKLIDPAPLPLPSALVEASPLTGRTHQIRVHAAESGFPICGDTLYGGSSFPRVCLHAAELAFEHPASGEVVRFRAPTEFAADARRALRDAIIEPDATTAARLIHGASDGWLHWYVERLGDFVLSQGEEALNPEQRSRIAGLGPSLGVYHKTLSRQVRRTSPAESSPQLVHGQEAPAPFSIRENGAQFELSFTEGYSVGLFLDQRDNRRRLLTGHVAAGFPLTGFADGPRRADLEVLNAFAYTCGFSVCAALAGAHTTSLDLAKKYLEWGRRNFRLNGLDPAQHDFIYGDAFDWLKRLARKNRAYDVVLLDPPTFSQSKESGVFQAEKDYGKLVAAALLVLKPGGVLFASTNAAAWLPEAFIAAVNEAICRAGRQIHQQHYVPQPPDFPISRAEPAYLKTVWLRVR